jgi:fused signal recognition particle receptor
MVFNWFRRQFANEGEGTPADGDGQMPPAPESSGETAEEAPEAPPEGEGDRGSATPEAPQVQEDYLAWAKMAYQNLQTQTVAPVEASDIPDAAEPVAEAEVAVEIEAESPEPEPIEVAAEPELAEPEPAESETAAPEPETVESSAVEAPEMTDAIAASEAASEPEAIAPETPEVLEVEATQEPEALATPEVAEAIAEPEALAEPDAIAPEPTEATEPTDATEPTEATPSLSFLERAEAERLERLERVRAEAIAEPEPEPEPESPPVPTIQFDEDFLWSAEILAAQGRRPEDISVEEITWLKRLRQGLDKTRRSLVNQLKSLVGQGPLNPEAVDEIESLLLQSDAGVEATDAIVQALQAKLREEALPPDAAIAYLKQILRDLLDRPWSDRGETYPGLLVPDKGQLNIWLMVGVNGAGKTTTIGKLSRLATKSGYRCLIAAADTFRAAAVEQVKVWGERAGVEVIANPGKNTDPAAVVYDAISAARSRNTELLLVDTAGRLQNKKNLMEELGKIRRIIDKQAPEARVEALVVLDATLGQNGLRQAIAFSEAANLSGAVLTKLDGTAKGGIALAVSEQLNLPIRFIGAGEGIEDLRPFSSYEFVEALLNG